MQPGIPPDTSECLTLTMSSTRVVPPEHSAVSGLHGIYLLCLDHPGRGADRDGDQQEEGEEEQPHPGVEAAKNFIHGRSLLSIAAGRQAHMMIAR